MKKGLLFLASLLMSAVSFAQWQAPITSADGVEMQEGEKYFLYNLKATGFLIGGNDWQTRASYSYETGDTVMIEAATEPGMYRIKVYAQRDNMGWRYMSCNDAGKNMWIDGKLNDGGYPGTEGWQLSNNGVDVYTITNSESSEAVLGAAEIVDGETGNTRLFMLDGSAAYDGELYDTWMFIPVETCEARTDALQAYAASIPLKAALDAAKEEYPNLDFSAQEAVYNTPTSTADELKAAEAAVAQIISDYKATLATFDEPFDLSEIIGANTQTYRPWVRTFTGDGQVGTETWNTWSGEAPSDGTNMTNPFRETWRDGKDKAPLSDMKITQTLEGASPGLYMLSINARLYCEYGGIEQFEGAEMFFGDTRINMQEQTPMTKSGDKCVLWNPNKFNIIAIVKEAGDIEFGFEFTNCNFNWLAFKETSLKYYGNQDVEANAQKLAKAIYEFEKKDPDVTAANPTVIADYNNAVDAFNAASMEELDAAVADVQAKKTALDNNIKAHENFYAKATVWLNNYQTQTADGLEGDLVDEFGDFLEGEDEEMESDEYEYPSPTVGYITSPYNTEKAAKYPFLTLEEVSTYISTVDGIWSDIVAKSVKEGKDVTSLLKNPDFGSSTSTYNSETGTWSEGTYTLDGWVNETNSTINLGGLRQLMCCEVYDQTATFYQVVKGAPAGLYKIETQAYDRPGSIEASADNINYYLFMNKFKTRIPHVISDPLIIADEDKSNIVDGGNVWLTTPSDKSRWSGSNYDGGYDNLVETPIYAEDGETVLNPYGAYCPNNMYSAAMHFDDGRYKVATYGMVGDGEDMKIGVTSNGHVTNEWFIFSGFKLTFMGKDPVAVASVLADKWNELNEMLQEKGAELTNGCVTAAQQALDNSKDMTAENTEKEALWNAFQDVINALADCNENLTESEKLLAAIDDMDTAAETVASYDGGDETDAYKKYDGEVKPKADAWKTLDTEGVKALTEEVKEMTTELNEAAHDLELAEIIANMATASDDEPVDCTEAFIQNWDFSVAENDAFPGWDYWKKGGNGPVKGSGIDGQSFETWSGNFGGGAGLGFWVAQDLTDLPAGTYDVSALAYHFANGNSDDINKWDGFDEQTGESTAPTGRVYLCAWITDAEGNSRVCSLPVEPRVNDTDSDIAALDEDVDRYHVFFTIGEGSQVTIGFQTNGTQPFQWFGADNFNLQYHGTESTYAETENEGGLTGIDGVKAGAVKNGKFFLNKSVVIFKNGKKFNVAGQAIK